MAFEKLLLIIPPQRLVMEGFRTALIALAGYVQQRMPALEIKLLDLSTGSPNTVRRALEGAMAGVGAGRVLVGVSTVTADYQAALLVARIVKTIDGNAVVVLGGHHASADAKVVLINHPSEVDFVVHGEGEIPLQHLLMSYPAVSDVPGISFLRKSEYVRNASPPLLGTEDLDRIPLTFAGNDLLAAPGKFDHVTYVSARGCPLSCSFCAVSNQAIRAKSVPQVMTDIRHLVGMGYSRIAFEDNFFAHSARRTREVCSGLAELRAEGLAFGWDCQTRVESIDNDHAIGLLERAGCEAVYLGVEGLNDATLTFLGKTRAPRVYLSRLFDRVIPRLLQSRLGVYLNLQFGLPGEEDSQVGETIEAAQRLGEMAAKLGKTITVFPQLFVVYPGTEHFQRYVAMRDFPADVFESFTAWELEQEPTLIWLGETFAHGVGGLPMGILDRHGLAHRRYAVDEEAVARISETIERIARLSGIEVFRYGAHLVKEKPNGEFEVGRRFVRSKKEAASPSRIGVRPRHLRLDAHGREPGIKRRNGALHNRDCDQYVPSRAGRPPE